jgi:hypothetical protein
MKTVKKDAENPFKTKKHGNDLVTVAKYGNAMEAYLAGTKLRSRKIKSYVFDENLISLMPVYDIGLGGVRLQVKEGDLDKASKLLGEKVRGSFWAPKPLVLATHLFSGLVFGVFLTVAVLLFFWMKNYF